MQTFYEREDWGFTSNAKIEMLDPVPSSNWLGSPLRVFLLRQFRLLEDLTFIDPEGHETVVPKGTISDGPSVPLLLQMFLPSRFDLLESGIYHDLLCNTLKRTKRYADDRLYYAIRSQGRSHFTAWCYWAAVRCFSPFRK